MALSDILHNPENICEGLRVGMYLYNRQNWTHNDKMYLPSGTG